MKSKEQRVLDVLRGHRGAAAAISARELGRRSGLIEREVRRIIADRRAAWMDEHGLFVCTKSGGGFWLADDIEQVYAMLAWFHALAMTARAKYAAAKTACEKQGVYFNPTKGKK